MAKRDEVEVIVDMIEKIVLRVEKKEHISDEFHHEITCGVLQAIKEELAARKFLA